MTTWALVALAGGMGAVARALVDVAVSARFADGPWGTFVVNMTGSLAAGVVVGLGAAELAGADAVRVVAGGFLGAYTTFSTHALDSVQLIGERRGLAAVANLAGSAVLGTALAGVGLLLATLGR